MAKLGCNLMVQLISKSTQLSFVSTQARHVMLGAAGFIGQAVVRKLLCEGCSVIVIGQPAHAEFLKNTGGQSSCLLSKM